MKPKALASRLFNRNSGATGESQSLWTKYGRQVDCTDQQSTCHDGVQQQSSGRKEKCHKVPERYDPVIEEGSYLYDFIATHRSEPRYFPLMEEESLDRDREEKKKKKNKEKYDKMKKAIFLINERKDNTRDGRGHTAN